MGRGKIFTAFFCLATHVLTQFWLFCFFWTEHIEVVAPMEKQSKLGQILQSKVIIFCSTKKDARPIWTLRTSIPQWQDTGSAFNWWETVSRERRCFESIPKWQGTCSACNWWCWTLRTSTPCLRSIQANRWGWILVLWSVDCFHSYSVFHDPQVKIHGE